MTYSFKVAGWPERLWRTNNNADIARGNVPGSTPFAAFGEKIVTGSGTSILWSTGMPDTLTVPDSIQLTVVSTSASDTGSIGIRYLDGNLLERTETLTLNGTTPVTTVATDVRAINNVYSKAGPVVGNVTLTNGGAIYARIVAGRLEHTSSLQRIPANKRLMIGSLYAGSSSGTSASKVLVRLVTSFINGDSFADQGYLHTTGAVSLQDSSTTLAGFGPFPIPPGEWVGLQASWDKSADITGGFFGYLENA